MKSVVVIVIFYVHPINWAICTTHCLEMRAKNSDVISFWWLLILNTNHFPGFFILLLSSLLLLSHLSFTQPKTTITKTIFNWNILNQNLQWNHKGNCRLFLTNQKVSHKRCLKHHFSPQCCSLVTTVTTTMMPFDAYCNGHDKINT